MFVSAEVLEGKILVISTLYTYLPFKFLNLKHTVLTSLSPGVGIIDLNHHTSGYCYISVGNSFSLEIV